MMLAPPSTFSRLDDSIAEGAGDWLLGANGDRTKPLHSADVIRQNTGCDAVSFGRAGASSQKMVEAYILRL